MRSTNPYLHLENYVSHRRGPVGHIVLFANLGEPAANGCTYYVECQAHGTKSGVNSLREFAAYIKWLEWCPNCQAAATTQSHSNNQQNEPAN